MLPDVKVRLRAIMERKKVADSLRDEVERFSLVGFEVPESREKTNQLDSVVRDLMAKIAELEDLGVKLRDIDTGSARLPGQEVRRGRLPVLEIWRVRRRVLAHAGRRVLEPQADQRADSLALTPLAAKVYKCPAGRRPVER